MRRTASRNISYKEESSPSVGEEGSDEEGESVDDVSYPSGDDDDHYEDNDDVPVATLLAKKKAEEVNSSSSKKHKTTFHTTKNVGFTHHRKPRKAQGNVSIPDVTTGAKIY